MRSLQQYNGNKTVFFRAFLYALPLLCALLLSGCDTEENIQRRIEQAKANERTICQKKIDDIERQHAAEVDKLKTVQEQEVAALQTKVQFYFVVTVTLGVGLAFVVIGGVASIGFVWKKNKNKKDASYDWQNKTAPPSVVEEL